MKKTVASIKSRSGRPLSFDRDAALKKAMLLFWNHGYEATSLNDLTKAMGITPPSLYYAFGDKKHLFFEALALYLSGPQSATTIISDANTARDAARGLLLAASNGFTGDATPPGCMLASSAISCSNAAADVKARLAAIRGSIEKCLRQKIKRGVQNGEFTSVVDVETLAAHVMAVIQGMSTLARDGASREKLLRIAGISMQAWPN